MNGGRKKNVLTSLARLSLSRLFPSFPSPFFPPFPPSLAPQIEEEIRLKNVQANMESAIEYNPEAFGRVCMLYVPMTVNNHPLKAFIDSGAQSSIMSESCARQCGLLRYDMCVCVCARARASCGMEWVG
mgnify:CR=1 FL=1